MPRNRRRMARADEQKAATRPPAAGRAGVRRLAARFDPVALVLMVTAVFVWITDKPIHALFLGSIGVVLAWTTLRRRSTAQQTPPAETAAPRAAGGRSGNGGTVADGDAPRPDGGTPRPDGDAPQSDSGFASPGPATTSSPLAAIASGGAVAVADADDEPEAAGRRGTYHRILVVGMGVTFALAVAAFPRFSWPATVAVVAVAAFAVVRGWEHSRSPEHESSPGDDRCTRPRLAIWAIAFCAGALWELAALLQQPSLREDSYDHPTISVLMDGLLAGYWGRAVVLLLWLGLGWFLIREVER